jgi:NAD(P)-dependent dehydrogenase (short-subunit alcohol dehydrogenase family)
MGLAAAKEMGITHYVIICGRSARKLENAITELRAEGIECEAFPCDISNRASVQALAVRAKGIGPVQAVIHAAGMSPHMGDARKIMEANALGTIFMNTEFALVMGNDGCIVNVSSMSAYLAPALIMPKSLYKMSLFDEEAFLKKMMGRVNIFPAKLRSGVAYAISKNFVVWYAKKSALLYGHKDIRVVCVSPGNFETPMGKLEEQEAQVYMKNTAIKRFGRPEEIAYLFAAIVNKRNSFLTGVDILCDGGLVAGTKL